MVGLEPVTLRLPVECFNPLLTNCLAGGRAEVIMKYREEEGEVTGLLDTAGGRVE